MQQQTSMLNLFVEFRFQLLNMKTLFYFKLRRSVTLIPTTFRSTGTFKNVGILVPKEMLMNTCVKMPNGFTNITSYTTRTCKLMKSVVVFLQMIVTFVPTRPFGIVDLAVI